jgi:hypothetical protein
VVGGDAGADQAIRDRQAVDDINPHILTKCLLRGLGCIIASRTRTDDCDMPQGALLPLATLEFDNKQARIERNG